MNNLLLRRRLMLGGNPPNIAVSVEDNPEFVALMYNAGHCASPEYITVEEAEAFTGPLPSGTTNCPHLDLRYFINYTPQIWNLSGLKYKITLANKPDPAGVNACLSDAGDGLTVVLPENVSSIDPWFINDGLHITYATVIIEREIPPTIKQARPNLFHSDSTDILIFVPDEAVETYKADAFWGQYQIRPMSIYNNSTRLIFSHECTNGYELVPVSVDSTNATIEVESVPDEISTETADMILFVPRGEGLGKQPNRNASLVKADATHVVMANNDTYTLMNNPNPSSFTIKKRVSYTSPDVKSLFSIPGDYILEVVGDHTPSSSGSEIKFIIRGYQGCTLGYTRPSSTMPTFGCNTIQRAKVHIESLSDKSVTIKEQYTEWWRGNNDMAYKEEYHSTDIREATWTDDATNKLQVQVPLTIGAVFNIYRVIN